MHYSTSYTCAIEVHFGYRIHEATCTSITKNRHTDQSECSTLRTVTGSDDCEWNSNNNKTAKWRFIAQFVRIECKVHICDVSVVFKQKIFEWFLVIHLSPHSRHWTMGVFLFLALIRNAKSTQIIVIALALWKLSTLFVVKSVVLLKYFMNLVVNYVALSLDIAKRCFFVSIYLKATKEVNDSIQAIVW